MEKVSLFGYSEGQCLQNGTAVIAGPVENNRCAMTNLDWVIDGSDLTKRHGVKFAILNDFEANGGTFCIFRITFIVPY